jgi:hypothetical protein
VTAELQRKQAEKEESRAKDREAAYEEIVAGVKVRRTASAVVCVVEISRPHVAVPSGRGFNTFPSYFPLH